MDQKKINLVSARKSHTIILHFVKPLSKKSLKCLDLYKLNKSYNF